MRRGPRDGRASGLPQIKYARRCLTQPVGRSGAGAKACGRGRGLPAQRSQLAWRRPDYTWRLQMDLVEDVLSRRSLLVSSAATG